MYKSQISEPSSPSSPWTPPTFLSLALTLTSAHNWAHPHSASLAPSFTTSPLLHRYTPLSSTSSSSSSSSPSASVPALISTASASNHSFTSLNLLPPLMDRSEIYTNEIALGNGCFNYPAASTIPTESMGRFSRSPIKSRMETSYLQNTKEDFRSHHQTGLQPTTSTSTPIHLVQQVVQNNNADADVEDVQDRSPGWKLSLIKRTPIKPAVDTFWAKYPSLVGHQQQPFPARAVSMAGPWTPWTPWWLPSPLTIASSSLAYLIPNDDASLSQSADSSLSTPQDNLNSRIKSEEEVIVSATNLDRVNNKDYYSYHPRGSSTSNTAVATTTATDSSDIILHEDMVVPCSSSALTCKKESLWSYWDVQQEQDKGQDKKQAKDQSSTQNISQLTTTAATSITLLMSMELTDPLGASSPTLPTPTQISIFSHHPSPSSTPHGSVQSSYCTEVIGFPRLQGSHSRIIEQEATIVNTPTWTTSPCCSSTANMAGLGLGIRLSYFHDYKSVKITTPETVAVAEAMDRIRHRVASSELNQQYSYLARSNRLLEMLLRDEKGKGNDEKDGDSRF